MGIRHRFEAVEAVVSTGERFDKETKVGLLLVLPIFLLVAVTLVYPFLRALWISFHNIGANEFVGLKHYRWLFGNNIFRTAFRNSLIWTIGNLALQGLVGIGLALLLHEQFFGRDAIRTVLLIPFVLPAVVTSIMWKWMLNATYGPINHWLLQFGLIQTPLNPITSPKLALFVVMLINTWRWSPLVALVVFAVLQTIPQEEYEAARIEGAGAFREFYHVTYPHLKGSLTVLGLIGFLLTFNLFSMIWLLTKGGPVNASTTLPVLVYELAYNRHAVGQATAVSVILFLILVVFVVLYFQQEEIKESEFL